MSYNRIKIPRAYVDMMQFLYSTGWATPGNLGYGSGTDIANTPGANIIQDDGSTAVTLDSGHIMNLFDGHPNNYIIHQHIFVLFYACFIQISSYLLLHMNGEFLEICCIVRMYNKQKIHLLKKPATGAARIEKFNFTTVGKVSYLVAR